MTVGTGRIRFYRCARKRTLTVSRSTKSSCTQDLMLMNIHAQIQLGIRKPYALHDEP